MIICLHLLVALLLDSISIPKTIVEALSHHNWRFAMKEEMDALDANGTWEPVPLPLVRKQLVANGCSL